MRNPDEVPKTQKIARRMALGIVSELIASYFDVGQPFNEGDRRGWTEAQIGRLRAEIQHIKDSLDRRAEARVPEPLEPRK